MMLLNYHHRDYPGNTNVMQEDVAITFVETIAQRIKHAREAIPLTQAQLGKRAGVSQGTIGNLESGIRSRPRDLLALATALNVSPQWLETGKGEKSPDPLPTQKPAETAQTVSFPEALVMLKNALLTMDAAARESAATLLSSMARNPEGQWMDWLVDLIKKEANHAKTDKSDRTGIPASVPSVETPTMAKAGAAADKPGPDLQKAFDAGSDEKPQPGGVSNPGTESGH